MADNLTLPIQQAFSRLPKQAAYTAPVAAAAPSADSTTVSSSAPRSQFAASMDRMRDASGHDEAMQARRNLAAYRSAPKASNRLRLIKELYNDNKRVVKPVSEKELISRNRGMRTLGDRLVPNTGQRIGWRDWLHDTLNNYQIFGESAYNGANQALRSVAKWVDPRSWGSSIDARLNRMAHDVSMDNADRNYRQRIAMIRENDATGLAPGQNGTAGEKVVRALNDVGSSGMGTLFGGVAATGAIGGGASLGVKGITGTANAVGNIGGNVASGVARTALRPVAGVARAVGVNGTTVQNAVNTVANTAGSAVRGGSSMVGQALAAPLKPVASLNSRMWKGSPPSQYQQATSQYSLALKRYHQVVRAAKNNPAVDPSMVAQARDALRQAVQGVRAAGKAQATSGVTGYVGHLFRDGKAIGGRMHARPVSTVVRELGNAGQAVGNTVMNGIMPLTYYGQAYDAGKALSGGRVADAAKGYGQYFKWGAIPPKLMTPYMVYNTLKSSNGE